VELRVLADYWSCVVCVDSCSPAVTDHGTIQLRTALSCGSVDLRVVGIQQWGGLHAASQHAVSTSSAVG
jgi:hypothetical protein